MPTRKERIEGGLIGLLVGDALGWPERGRESLRGREIPAPHPDRLLALHF